MVRGGLGMTRWSRGAVNARAPSSPIYADLASTLDDFDLMVFSSTSDPLLGPPTTEAGVEAVVADFDPNLNQAKAKWEAAKKTVWKVAEAEWN